MTDIVLQDLITEETNALAAHDEEFEPLLHLVRLLGEGTEVSFEHLAAATQRTRAEIETFAQSFEGQVTASGTMNLRPSPHRFVLEDGKTLPGACAMDTLVCPATGMEICLTLTAQGSIEQLDPIASVVSLLLRGPEHGVEPLCEWAISSRIARAPPPGLGCTRRLCCCRLKKRPRWPVSWGAFCERAWNRGRTEQACTFRRLLDDRVMNVGIMPRRQ